MPLPKLLKYKFTVIKYNKLVATIVLQMLARAIMTSSKVNLASRKANLPSNRANLTSNRLSPSSDSQVRKLLNSIEWEII